MPATHTKDVLHKFLKPGMKLSINFEFGPKDKFNYSTVYLGIKENSYLILDIPMRLLEDQVMRKLHNADVIVRGVSDTELGHVLAFKSSVLMTAVRPSPLLFIRIPGTFATKPVREHERYKLQMDCTIDHSGNIYDGSLVDFSLAGVGVQTFIEPEFKVGDRVSVVSPLSIHIGEENPCLIANIKKQPKGWVIGIRFEQPITMTEDLKTKLLEQSFLTSNV
ncbi:flagellar brake protein [Vibrio parahaemolyticus]|uniref:flagellar brake protein n=1 Tax=Vibrio parahaemolyticus TaxID=670 RepID=UPI00111EC993|nr:flagellar brake protein [Vibrio parahaemolyticus]TOR09783.1 pilus assembly protein PilZ [Vibrio parahaemolyticus]